MYTVEGHTQVCRWNVVCVSTAIVFTAETNVLWGLRSLSFGVFFFKLVS